ncbi:MAG TPA: cyclic nucleotide-binding domain-containing protein [Sphingomicrobium sp.]|nr:cyclic nucleotide-binding domain-containing protein [Sphingomicrobium sp.]
MGAFDYPDGRAPDVAATDRLTFLAGESEEGWRRILALVDVAQFRAGTDILQVGQRDNAFYIVTSGAVQVIVPGPGGSERVICEIAEGSVFGEIAFFDGAPRSATVRAIGDCWTVRVTRGNFERLAAWHPDIARNMLLDLGRIMAARLRHTTNAV